MMAAIKGSPPRMRGTHIGTRNPELAAGITPAYAGNTVSFLTSNGSPWNHPRVCGEHISNPVGVITMVGPSPRMRGTPKGAATAQGGHEIIPAYAGNTRGQGAWSWWAWDHPRVCGKHGQVHAKPVLRTGSSPRMRGARGYRSEVLGVVRIIPAYTGSTLPKTAEIRRFRQQKRPKNFSSNTLHLSNNTADYPTGRAATNRNRTPSHGQHHTYKPS